MKKSLGIILVGAVAAVALAQVNAASLLGGFAKAMKEANTLDGNFTVQALGGAKVDYTVSLKKPNLARIETPTQVWIADGKNITVFNKGDKTYTKTPQTQPELNKLFASDDFSIWGAFFNEGWINPYSSKALGKKVVNGKAMETVEAVMDKNEGRVYTFFIDSSDKLAKKAVIELQRKDKGDAYTLIVDATGMRAGTDIKGDAFAFNAPADSREVTLAELNSDKWYTDINEAKAVASKTGRKIFIDFYATWCGPCKKLEKECFGTDTFKEYSKKLVFCRIDVDQQKSVASFYKITAMPTQIVADANGAPLATTVGYGNPGMFFKFLKDNS